MTTPDSALHQRVKGTFVGPIAPRLDQPKPPVVAINWEAYDVPRLWDMVRREDDEIAWGQARGFENLAQLLLSHHDRLRRQRELLCNAWNPDSSPAAARLFLLLDELIHSMAEDAVAHASTSRGMHAILTALKTAKEQVGKLKQEWDRVTTDWSPEWWDHAAEDLNRRARELIQRMDAAIGDYREQLVVPSLYTDPYTVSGMAVPEERSGYQPMVRKGSRAGSSAAPMASPINADGAAVSPPPSVPGHDPVMRRGPELQSVANVPQPVAAVPGSPISLLPVPPGNIYAPTGGAYVLPGPGIGRGRWIYPMPAPTPMTSSGSGSGVGLASSSTAGRTTGTAPTAIPTVSGPGRAASETTRPGKRNIVWQIASGVPPVIGEASPEKALAEEQLRLAEANFADWFADLATPWTDGLKPELARTEPNS